MQKLYLFKSDHEREKIGDVILDLNTIKTINCAIVDDCHVLAVHYDDDQWYKQWFKDENNFNNEFHNLLIAMGMSEHDALEMRKSIVMTKRTDQAQKAQKLKELIDSIAS